MEFLSLIIGKRRPATSYSQQLQECNAKQAVIRKLLRDKEKARKSDQTKRA